MPFLLLKFFDHGNSLKMLVCNSTGPRNKEMLDKKAACPLSVTSEQIKLLDLFIKTVIYSSAFFLAMG